MASDLTWQLVGTLGYRFNDRFSARAGYRHLKVDYDDGFIWDVDLTGPIVGATIRFCQLSAVVRAGRHDEETAMKTIAMLAEPGLLIALPVAAQQMFFYPSQGQSPQQQSRDQSECHTWAVQQSSFDPANPPAPTVAAAPAPAREGQVIRGGARETVLGVVGGAIAGEAGKGAAIGAATGALVGGFRRRDQSTAQAEQQAAGQQQYEAPLAQQHDAYNRALAACMQGRGYSVS